MRITAKVEVAAPLGAVFAAATDHEGIEERARGWGVELRREGDGEGPLAPGAAWRARFIVRGRPREARIALLRLDPPALAEAEATGRSLALRLDARFLALSPGRTGVTLAVEARARSLSGRLLLLGAPLARRLAERRVAGRLGDWARRVEARAARHEERFRERP